MTLGSTKTSNRNEYQEYFLVGKGGRCVALTLPSSCVDCLEIMGVTTFWIPTKIYGHMPTWEIYPS